MVTGLLNPSGGSAELFGIKIFEEIDRVREILGVCPQQDILFDMLTPYEHLMIFSLFKGTVNEAPILNLKFQGLYQRLARAHLF